MIGFIKYSLFFSLNFLLLAIPIKNKTLFHYAHEVAEPLIKPVYTEIGIAIDKGKTVTQNLFRNASPNIPVKDYSDKVNRKLSARYKETVKSKENKSSPKTKKSPYYEEDFLDDIHDGDKKAIKGLFKK